MNPALIEPAISRLLDRPHAAAEITPFPPFPPELILKIMQYLPQKDLRNASLVSREFYGLALAAGLCIPLTVKWHPSLKTDGFDGSLSKLDSVVDYAKTARPALNIAIRAVFMEYEPARIASAAARFFASVDLALPYLVRLDMQFPQYTPDSVYTHLCAHPAPKLKSLAIEHRPDRAASVPRDLFKCAAPNLRALHLKLASTESLRAWATLPVFQRITRLQLSARETPRPLVLARLFPHLRALYLGTLQLFPSPGRTIDLAGLQLEYIALAHGTDNLIDPSALDAIPVVEVRGKLSDTVWPPAAQAGPICARAEAVGVWSAALSLGAADGEWRRTIALSGPARDAALPLSSTLVSLTLDKCLVSAFVQVPVELVALRELFLDVSAPGASAYCWPPLRAATLGQDTHFDELPSARVRVRCPALVRVVIFVVPGGGCVTVRPTKVTRLGRAIGLGAPGPTPTLTLAGCSFHDPPIWPALNKLFARVELVGCAAGDAVPGYYHTGCYSGVFEGASWL